MSFYPAPTGGGGGIGGSIALNQVAFGTANATIGGSNSLTWSNAVLLINGGQRVKRIATAVDYAVQLTDYIIAITDDTAPRTMTLPTAASAETGKTYIFVDEGGGAGVNNITVAAAMGETISGVASIVIKIDYGTVAVYCSGSEWFALYFL